MIPLPQPEVPDKIHSCSLEHISAQSDENYLAEGSLINTCHIYSLFINCTLYSCSTFTPAVTEPGERQLSAPLSVISSRQLSLRESPITRLTSDAGQSIPCHVTRPAQPPAPTPLRHGQRSAAQPIPSGARRPAAPAAADSDTNGRSGGHVTSNRPITRPQENGVADSPFGEGTAHKRYQVICRGCRRLHMGTIDVIWKAV